MDTVSKDPCPVKNNHNVRSFDVDGDASLSSMSVFIDGRESMRDFNETAPGGEPDEEVRSVNETGRVESRLKIDVGGPAAPLIS